jgi:hypothetical protein
MVHVTSTVVALKTVTLVLGGLITYFAFKAYRRTGAPPLRALALGFGTVTLGSLLAGVVDRLLETAGTTALVVESALTAIGFAIILYSLYAE